MAERMSATLGASKEAMLVVDKSWVGREILGLPLILMEPKAWKGLDISDADRLDRTVNERKRPISSSSSVSSSGCSLSKPKSKVEKSETEADACAVEPTVRGLQLVSDSGRDCIRSSVDLDLCRSLGAVEESALRVFDLKMWVMSAVSLLRFAVGAADE